VIKKGPLDGLYSIVHGQERSNLILCQPEHFHKSTRFQGGCKGEKAFGQNRGTREYSYSRIKEKEKGVRAFERRDEGISPEALRYHLYFKLFKFN